MIDDDQLARHFLRSVLEFSGAVLGMHAGDGSLHVKAGFSRSTECSGAEESIQVSTPNRWRMGVARSVKVEG